MDIGKLTTGIPIKENSNKKLDMTKSDMEKAVKSWNTAKADVKLSSMTTIYDKADQVQAIKDLLVSAGIELNETNLQLLEAMIDGGLGVDLSTLQKFKQQTQLFNLLEKQLDKPTDQQPDLTPADLLSKEAGSGSKEAQAIPLSKETTPFLKETATQIAPTAKEATAKEATAIPAATLEKSIMVLKNQLPVNSTTTQLINKFADSQLNLTTAFESLAMDIAQFSSPVLKQAVMDHLLAHPEPEPAHVANQSTDQAYQSVKQAAVHPLPAPPVTQTASDVPLTSPDSPPSQLDSAPTHLASTEPELAVPTVQQKKVAPQLPVENLTPKEIETLLQDSYKLDLSQAKDVIDQTLNRLSNNIRSLSETLASDPAFSELSSTTDSQATNRFMTSLNQINQTLHFSQSFQNAIYIPLPLVVHDQKLNGELFVFKDGKNKNKAKNNATSALIGLDTANLGRIETYIQKNGTKVSLQFRLGEERTERLLKQNINKLTAVLDIASVVYLPMEKPFEPVAVTTPGVLNWHDGFEKFA